MSIQDDSLRNLMLTSDHHSLCVPRWGQFCWWKKRRKFLKQRSWIRFDTEFAWNVLNTREILNLKLYYFFQVILCIWYANTSLMKNKPCYQPGRCTPLSHKCPNKQDWRSQIRSKTWPINAYVGITTKENSRAAPQPAEAKVWQRHLSLLYQRNLLIRLPRSNQ